MIEREKGAAWEYVVAAVFAMALAVALLGIKGKFHDIDVELEAEGIADDLSSTIQRVANSDGELSTNHPLPARIGGHDYLIEISDNSVTIMVPDENLVKKSFYEGVKVETRAEIGPGENLVIIKSDGKIIINASR